MFSATTVEDYCFATNKPRTLGPVLEGSTQPVPGFLFRYSGGDIRGVS